MRPVLTASIFTTPESSFIFVSPSNNEMLRIAPDGFYVRGKRIEQDESEAQTVYNVFMDWFFRHTGYRSPEHNPEPHPHTAEPIQDEVR